MKTQMPGKAKDGRIGRFGWKGQVASLDDFVLAACANELGLEVPGHHQAVSPVEPNAEPPGLDMTQAECDDLIAYVRSLPAPVAVNSTNESLASAGWTVFDSIGCSTCHVPSLGKVYGLYSDLLLHIMGAELTDEGGYYGAPLNSNDELSIAWRTPPLWGVRSSGPFMHDGRAATLAQAVALHGGQGRHSRQLFFSLAAHQRRAIMAFLDTLSAPGDANAGDAPDRTRADSDDTDAEPRGLTGSPAQANGGQIRGKLRAAQELERQGKNEAAVEFYRQVLKVAPDSAEASIASARIAVLKAVNPPRPR